MATTFSWLDHSEEHRRKVLDIIDLFKEQGTVDELGMGTVRDAMADILFPGTSNLMTRAAYYVFVPWIYQKLEAQKTPSNEIAARARRLEVRLIDELLSSGELVGVIGRLAKGSLRRLPSSMYWAGLRRLGIGKFDGSQDGYHRSLDRFYQHQRGTIKMEDGERLGGVRANWHPRLPAPPADWPKGALLRLTAADAEFLRDQITVAAPHSLFALLVRGKDAPRDIEYPWAHPEKATFSERINTQLWHAQNISEVMHGAALLYNLVLSELSSNDQLVAHYRERLSDWSGNISARLSVLSAWDRSEAWKCVESEGARMPRPTRDFVDRWCELVVAADPTTVADDEQARLLVKQRERKLKGPLARVENRRALELWQGASSAEPIQYRWSNADVLIRDIVTAVHGGADARAA
jgi:hypothetical protein